MSPRAESWPGRGSAPAGLQRRPQLTHYRPQLSHYRLHGSHYRPQLSHYRPQLTLQATALTLQAARLTYRPQLTLQATAHTTGHSTLQAARLTLQATAHTTGHGSHYRLHGSHYRLHGSHYRLHGSHYRLHGSLSVRLTEEVREVAARLLGYLPHQRHLLQGPGPEGSPAVAGGHSLCVLLHAQTLYLRLAQVACREGGS